MHRLYSLGIVLLRVPDRSVPFRGETGAAVRAGAAAPRTPSTRDVRADACRHASRCRSCGCSHATPTSATTRLPTCGPRCSTPGCPAPAPARPRPGPDDEPTAENESFARSERGWLVPALFILLIATAITVAGLLLLRETGIGVGSDDGASTTSTAVPVTTEPERFSDAITFDPRAEVSPGRTTTWLRGPSTATRRPPGAPRPTTPRTSSGPRPAWASAWWSRNRPRRSPSTSRVDERLERSCLRDRRR